MWYNIQVSKTRPVGQAAKTPPFHGGNGSSILPRVTKTKKPRHSAWFFRFGDSCLIEKAKHKVLCGSSHSPLGDRQARLSGVERANIRRRRNSPNLFCFIQAAGLACNREAYVITEGAFSAAWWHTRLRRITYSTSSDYIHAARDWDAMERMQRTNNVSADECASEIFLKNKQNLFLNDKISLFL